MDMTPAPALVICGFIKKGKGSEFDYWKVQDMGFPQ
jgi:hypothetical protein